MDNKSSIENDDSERFLALCKEREQNHKKLAKIGGLLGIALIVIICIAWRVLVFH